MIILDGKKVADEICGGLKERVNGLVKRGVHPCLNIIVANKDKASLLYVQKKQKVADNMGIKTKVFAYEDFDYINYLKYEDVLISKKQVPTIAEMPIQNTHFVYRLFNDFPAIDIDGFSLLSAGHLLTDTYLSYCPCTTKGIMRLLNTYNIPLEGKNVTILGRSNIVGRPLFAMMMNQNATVTVCHSKTPANVMKQHCINADIIVSATGVPNLVTRDMVSQNAVVIDAGINYTAEGKLCGDVDFENVAPICSYITPVPKGVGPMTVAMLMENVIDYYENWYKER